MGRMAGWLEGYRALGRAFVDLLGAELEALGRDLGRSGRGLLTAVLLLAISLFLLFWALGALVSLAVLVIALWLPLWASVLIVLLALLLAVMTLALVARARIRRLERPAETLRRRLDDHLEWWHRRLLSQGEEGGDRADPSGEEGWE